jgi:hypothetical protein
MERVAVRMSDVGRAGGRIGSLGEMIGQLWKAGVRLPGSSRRRPSRAADCPRAAETGEGTQAVELPAEKGLPVSLNPDTVGETWLYLARGEKSAA